MSIYGYVRVSSQSQNEDRQIMQLHQYGCDRVFMDKFSGKSFKRPSYQKLKGILQENDTIVFLSIDRLGRNYEQIKQEWKYFNDNNINIEVIDMPLLSTKNQVNGLDGKFISNLVLEILSYVAEKERINIKERQKQGIEAAKLRGIKFGRPKTIITQEQEKILRNYVKNGRVNVDKAIKNIGLARSTFYRLLNEYGL